MTMIKPLAHMVNGLLLPGHPAITSLLLCVLVDAHEDAASLFLDPHSASMRELDGVVSHVPRSSYLDTEHRHFRGIGIQDLGQRLGRGAILAPDVDRVVK